MMRYNNFAISDLNDLPYMDFDVYYTLIKNRIAEEEKDAPKNG